MTTTTLPPLTARQAEVYAAILDYWAEYARPPSVRELGAALGIGSPNGVVCHLAFLTKKGWVEWRKSTGQRGTARGIWPAGLRERIAVVVEEMRVADR